MKAIDLLCEAVSRELSLRMGCKVKVMPAVVYSDTLLTPDGAEPAQGWNEKTVTVTVSEEVAGDGTANGRMMGRGLKKLARIEDFPVSLNTDSVYTLAGKIRSALNVKMGV